MQKIEKEFERVGVKHAIRFEAIKNENGALGCAKSHHALLESYTINRNKLLMVCEDDCIFVEDRSHIDKIIREFSFNTNFDVLCLAFNKRNGIKLSSSLEFTSDTQTLACYVLKPHMISKMKDVALESISELENGRPKNKAAIDVVWKKLQKKYVFVVPTKRVAKQSASFSDIEQRIVEYGV